MKSTIKVDFKGLYEEGQKGFEPIISVNLVDSPDVRDGLLAAYFEKLGAVSSWLEVVWPPSPLSTVETGTVKRITLLPVKPEHIPDMIDIAKTRLPQVKDDGNMKLPSFCQIGESVIYTTPKAYEYAKMTQEKRAAANGGNPDDFVSEQFYGKVTAVKFTEGKVWYDILDDHDGRVFEELDSAFIVSKN